MDKKQKITLLAELFEVEENEVTPEKQLSDLKWDSLAMLGLIALLKSECNKTVKPTDLRALQTVQDVFDLMD